MQPCLAVAVRAALNARHGRKDGAEADGLLCCPAADPGAGAGQRRGGVEQAGVARLRPQQVRRHLLLARAAGAAVGDGGAASGPARDQQHLCQLDRAAAQVEVLTAASRRRIPAGAPPQALPSTRGIQRKISHDRIDDICVCV